MNNGSARVEECLYLVRGTKLSTLTRRTWKKPFFNIHLLSLLPVVPVEHHYCNKKPAIHNFKLLSPCYAFKKLENLVGPTTVQEHTTEIHSRPTLQIDSSPAVQFKPSPPRVQSLEREKEREMGAARIITDKCLKYFRFKKTAKRPDLHCPLASSPPTPHRLLLDPKL